MLFAMPISLFIKIRIFIVLLISMSFFGAMYWYLIEPLNSNGVISVFEHHYPGKVLLLGAGGGLVVTILSLVAGRLYAKHLSILALPAGLTAWGAMTGRMDQLLLACTTAAERAGLFHRLILDSLFWTGLVLVVFFLVQIVIKIGKSDSEIYQNYENTPKKEVSLPKQKKGLLSSSSWLKNVMAIGLSCVIAFLLLKVLAQSGRADYRLTNFQTVQISTIPSIKQILFAVLVAFAAGAFAAHQLFSTKLAVFFLSPALVSIVAYGLASQSWAMEPLAQSNSPILLSSVGFAGILPIQYVGIGSLGVIAGYWLSIYTNQVRLAHGK